MADRPLQQNHPAQSPSAPGAAERRFRRRPSSIQLLNSRVDKVSRADVLDWVRFFLLDGRPHQLITANPLMLLAAEKDDVLKDVFNRAALVIPESTGVSWASHQAGTPLEEIVPGIDLFQNLCQFARDNQRSVFLLGAKPGIADQAARTLAVQYPGLHIAGTHHGYFRTKEEQAVVVAQIREAAPSFLFVALSVPGQEKWIYRHLQEMGVPVVMGVGGSLDVLSGNLRRAPVWVRELGLEWVFRTLQEPWRLKRIVHLPIFVWKILRST